MKTGGSAPFRFKCSSSSFSSFVIWRISVRRNLNCQYSSDSLNLCKGFVLSRKIRFLGPYASLGPYAWVQGRRATSKVTATSGGRLTNRYAWVPGRPTRRACLGVKLPLRVPPCKHYPEEVTEFKMAALILLRYRQRRLLRRNRIFGTGQTLYTNLMIWNCFGSLDSNERIFSK